MNSLPFSPKEIKTKQIFQYGNKPVEYTLIQSKRRKTCEVMVDKDEITIRSPFEKPIKEIEQILNDKIKWIFQKQKEIQREKPQIIIPSFNTNTTLPYLGRNYELQVIYNTKEEKSQEKIEFVNGMIRVYLDENENNVNDKIKLLYYDWLVYQADGIFKEKVNGFTKIVDVTYDKLVIKNLKNRWGSITKNKIINLNVNLIKAPEDIIDYIIIHEICHLKIKGHSYQFWNLLKQFIPDYKQKIKWLRVNSTSLIT